MKAGRLLGVGIAGIELSEDERRLLREVQPSGIILFARNLQDAAQLRALVRDLRAIVPDGVLMIDAEGGRVDRLRGIVGPAPAASDLARHPPALTRRAGRWVGESLAAFDLDLDFAPVADLDRGRHDNALDRRCYGTTPRAVTARARAFARGLRTAGVGTCLKHFPGLGAAEADTHHLPAAIAATATELERDLAPFIGALDLADTIMVGHASYPAWDPSGLPATLSPIIVSQLLRQRLGWQGVVFSDDLEMKALAAWGDLPELAARSLAVGCDGLLLCHSLAAVPAILERLTRADLRGEVTAASERLAALGQTLRRRARSRGLVASDERLRARLASVSAAAARP